MPPVITSRRARDRGQRGGDEAAGARLRRRERPAERAAAVEHDLLDPAPVGRVEEPPEPLRRAPSSSSSSRSSALGSATRSTWISKLRAQIVTSSPSPSPPASWKACATCDSPGPKKRSVRRSGGVPRSSTRRTLGGLERARPEPLQLGRRARQHDHRRPVRLDDEAGRGAGEPEDRGRTRAPSPASSPPPRSPRTAASSAPRPCARHLRSAPRAPRPRARRARRPSPRSATVRSSCVGPSPPDVATRSADADGLGDGSLELGRIVADDVDPRRLDPEREQRARQERTVQVGALAAHELAARDDDDRAWSRAVRARQAASAAKIFFAVTKTPCALTAAGSRTRLPLRRTSTFCGDSSRTQSTWPSNRCFWPRSSVPW